MKHAQLGRVDQQLSGIRSLALGQSAHCLPQKTGPRNKSSHFLSLVQSLIVFRLTLTQAVSIRQLILVCVQNCEVLALGRVSQGGLILFPCEHYPRRHFCL